AHLIREAERAGIGPLHETDEPTLRAVVDQRPGRQGHESRLRIDVIGLRVKSTPARGRGDRDDAPLADAARSHRDRTIRECIHAPGIDPRTARGEQAGGRPRLGHVASNPYPAAVSTRESKFEQPGGERRLRPPSPSTPDHAGGYLSAVNTV